MFPGIAYWLVLSLVPFIVVERLRQVGKAPRLRDYWGNLLISLSTPYLALPLGITAGVLSSVVLPPVHRIHRSIRPEHHNRNLAGSRPVFDTPFGTYERPSRKEFTETGLGLNSPAPQSLFAAQAGPLLTVGRWLRFRKSTTAGSKVSTESIF